MRVKTGS